MEGPANLSGWHARQDRVFRELFALRHHGIAGHDRAGADHRAVHDDGAGRETTTASLKRALQPGHNSVNSR